jgi:hypothetical protein
LGGLVLHQPSRYFLCYTNYFNSARRKILPNRGILNLELKTRWTNYQNIDSLEYCHAAMAMVRTLPKQFSFGVIAKRSPTLI